MIQTIRNVYTSLDGRYPTHAKIFRFLVSGGTAAAVDLGLLYAFTGLFGIWYLASSVLAFVIAFFVSFGLQKFWTFRDHSRDGMQAQMGVYLFISSCNLGLNTFLVYLLVDHFGFHYLVAQIVTSIFIACESFFAYQRFVFRIPAL